MAVKVKAISKAKKVAEVKAKGLKTAVRAADRRNKAEATGRASIKVAAKKAVKASASDDIGGAAIAEKKIKPTSMIVDMLLERKHTDKEILDAVTKRFGDGGYTQRLSYVSLVRSDVNHGHMGARKVAELGVTLPLPRLIRDDAGKLVEVISVK